MIKLIEFLGRLVVCGYRRAAVLEAGMKARQADTKVDQLAQFFKA